MSKLVGFSNGYPQQAAAGLPAEIGSALVSPSGIGAMAAAAIGGWFLGTVVGQSLKEDKLVWEAEDVVPGHMPSEVEELLTVWAALGGGILSWQVLEGLADKFGWKVLGLYTLGLGAIVLYRRT